VNAPEVAIGNGALGFWAALEAVFPATRQQHCWNSQLASTKSNVLCQLPDALSTLHHPLFHLENP